MLNLRARLYKRRSTFDAIVKMTKSLLKLRYIECHLTISTSQKYEPNLS